MALIKREIRAEMRQRLANLSLEERLRASSSICSELAAITAWVDARDVLLFWPRADEPDVRPLCHSALALGKQLCLPAYDENSDIYVARQILSIPGELIPGRFGLLEPAPHLPVIDIGAIDFAIVPALAFDEGGGRLGRGRGFYDRLLAGFRGLSCGVAFACQRHPKLPVEPHDVRMNRVVFG
jgi:5-formyltetrahydrofolate cyclo-ligase